MKILLCQNRSGIETLRVSIAYAQFVLAARVEDIADVRVSGYTSDGLLPTGDDIIKQIEEFQPDVLGLSIQFAFSHNSALAFIKKVRAKFPDLTIIAGGHQATFTARSLLETGLFDAIFCGEAEVSFREFVEKGDFKGINGVMYKEKDEFVKTPPAMLIDLNELNPPAYHLSPKGSLNLTRGIETSRGCPFDCEYCEVRNFFGNGKVRRMDTEKFISTLRHVVETEGGGALALMDDNITSDFRGHLKRLATRLAEEQMPVKLNISGRIDDFNRNLPMIPLLSKAGFQVVSMGLESIHEQTLAAMNKRAKYGREEIKNVLKSFRDNGLMMLVSLIFGYPGETPEMINETMDFLMDLDVDAIIWNLPTPLPGSQLYKRAVENGEFLSDNFDEFDLTHRVWSPIPDYTRKAAQAAGRRFYLRPEYLKDTFSWVLDEPSNLGALVKSTMVSSHITDLRRARPDSAEEWKQMIDGVLSITDARGPQRDDYTALVGFEFDGMSFKMPVEGGKPKAIVDTDDAPKVVLSSDAQTIHDLLVWHNLDILSAMVDGTVKITAEDVKDTMDFVDWFTSLQKTIRWATATKIRVPRLRYELQDWIRESDDRAKKFTERFERPGTMFIGNGCGGVSLLWSGDEVLDVYPSLERPKDVAWALDMEKASFGEMVGGGVEQLKQLLETADFQDLGGGRAAAIEAPEFFASLPGKFLPEKAKTVDMTVRYCVKSHEGTERTWTMVIKNGELQIIDGETEGTPTVTVVADEAVFGNLINGLMTPFELFTQKMMNVQGQPLMMIQMSECFEDLFTPRRA